jgi:hypothetical protein
MFLFSLSWFYYKWRQEESIPLKVKQKTIALNNFKPVLFFKAKNWGIAGNHEEITLSFSDSEPANKEKDYIFYTTEIFYKIEKNNSIVIYAAQSSISEPIIKNPDVKLKVLKNADEIKDYNINYQKYGLQKISIYE